MSRIAGGVLRFLGIFYIEVGTAVRIHNSAKSPLAGHKGTIIAVTAADPYGPYLVEFEHGMRFRYQASEFSVETSLDASPKNFSSSRGLKVLTKSNGR